jgi:hypothetical protein
MPMMRDLPLAAYLALPALSSHWCITAMTACPAKAHFEAQNPIEPTPAMLMGSAFHTLLLEPGKWSQTVAELTFDDYRKTEARAARDAAIAAGKVPLKPSEASAVKDMAAAALANRDVRELLEPGGLAEVSFVHDDGDLSIKARPDFFRTDEEVLIDVKGCPNAHPREFEKHADGMHYYIQAAFHRRVVQAVTKLRIKGYAYIAVEREPPYLSSVCWLDAAALDAGDVLADMAIQAYLDGQRTGFWPGYRASEISLKSWTKTDLMERNPSDVFQRAEALTQEQITANMAFQAPVKEAS